MTDSDLELIEHQLNLLVSARMMDGLTEGQELRYRQLCELERTMRRSDERIEQRNGFGGRSQEPDRT